MKINKLQLIICLFMARDGLFTSAQWVVTVAGSGAVGSTDGQGTQATFNGPRGVTVDKSGNIFISDWFSHQIRKINTSGYVSTFAGGGAAGGSPSGDAAQLSEHGPVLSADAE